MNNSAGDSMYDKIIDFLVKELDIDSHENETTVDKTTTKEDDKSESKRHCHPCPPCPPTQTHVHEFEESTKLAEEGEDRHNHRVAGVTSQVIFLHDGTGRHVHAICANTDFLDHHHEIGVITEPNINILPGTDKHIHIVRGTTTTDDDHDHDFLFTTQINAPLV